MPARAHMPLLVELRDDALAEKLDRAHDLLVGDLVRVHEAQQQVAAGGLVALGELDAPARVAAASSPSRYIAMRSTRSSGGTPTVKEQSPMPWRPISRWPSALLVAPHSGGCGFCSGLGCTRRGPPMCQYLPSAW